MPKKIKQNEVQHPANSSKRVPGSSPEAVAEKRTRLAIVRCDTHAYWYGAFMDEVDPLVLAAYSDEAPTRESVHNYFKIVGDPKHLKIERVAGFVISKVYDRVADGEKGGLQYGTYPGRAIAFSETFRSHPKVCDTVEDLVEGVDAAFIADSSSPKDGTDHLELARPFLERGIPTFVDKPFAATLADAQEMVRLAEKNNAVVMSASILAHTETGKFFQRRFDEIGRCGYLLVKGVGPANGAVIHGLAAAQGLVGYGVEWVECMGSQALECILLYYSSGLEVVVLNAPQSVFSRECSFYCSAYSNRGAVHSPPIGDPEFLSGTRNIVCLFKQMLETGKPPIPYQHMLEPIAIMEAARTAQREGRRVALSEVWDHSVS